MQKVKELLQKIKCELGKDVALVVATDNSFGLIDLDLEPILNFDNGDIEQELEKYLESCKE